VKEKQTMKKRLVAALAAGVALVSETAVQMERRPIPSLGQVKSIILSPYSTHWKGVFYPNGGAELRWGGTGTADWEGTFAIIPRESFSLEDIYNLLTPRLEQGRYSPLDVNVYFHVDGDDERPSYPWCLRETEENKEITRKLMSGLRDKAVPRDRETFEELLRERPFLHGDTPVAHTYSIKLSKDIQLGIYGDIRSDVFKEAYEEGAKMIFANRRKGYEIRGIEQPASEKESEERWLEEHRKAKEKAAREPPPPPVTAESLIAELGYGVPPAETPPPPSRPWLYAGALALLSAVGAAFWRIRRKR